MKKQVTKIVCATVAATVAIGIAAAAAGCSPYNKGIELNYTPSSDSALSNGGFAVEKGDYVYFINGVGDSTSNNDYGTPVKGAIMRITKDNLENRNYSAAQTLVPQIAYTSNYDAGIFVYGDYIYYGTPSTKRNSNGEVQNDRLEMKRTRLDGTESMKNAYVTFPSTSYDYRYVQGGDGTVYLLYVATSEKLYGESTGVTNIHSYNTKTGKNTLLAYNVASYLFDAEDKTNAQVYYTMKVYDYSGTSNTAYSYNQVYTVSAETTEQNEYDFDNEFGWDKDSDHYVNCGTLVFDGIGGKGKDSTLTQFNNKEGAVNDIAYSYNLVTYLNGTLFYTRSYTISGGTSKNFLFSVKQSDILSTSTEWSPIQGNPVDDDYLLLDGSSAAKYKYIFNGAELESVLIAESDGGISVNNVVDGKLSDHIDNKNYYRIVRRGSATMLFTHDEGDNKYIYYSVSGTGNGYSFYRVDYTGTWGKYNQPQDDESSKYTPVQLLDLDSVSDWYAPEIVANHILFASETDEMTVYNYVMAFNLKGLENKEDIDALNDLYNGIIGKDGIIDKYATDKDKYPTETYANLANAAKYLFYTSDLDYVKKLAVAVNAELDEDADPIYSENTLLRLAQFIDPTEGEENDWAAYTDTRTVNGKEVYANRRDYYYSVLGKMTTKDAESYAEDFKLAYLKSWPEKESVTWYQGLSTVERVFFIIGMCLIGLLVIAGAVILTVYLVRRSGKNKLKTYAKRKIKVDTTDDKDIDVYEDEKEEKLSHEE